MMMRFKLVGRTLTRMLNAGSRATKINYGATRRSLNAGSEAEAFNVSSVRCSFIFSFNLSTDIFVRHSFKKKIKTSPR